MRQLSRRCAAARRRCGASAGPADLFPACIADPAVTDSASEHVESAGAIADGLQRLGLNPVLVGGMALVVLGSRRVTRDFDFLVEDPGERLSGVVDLFYDCGLELVARLDEAGNVTATILRVLRA